MNGYFSEVTPLWPSQSFSLKVEEQLFHEKSKFQDIRVFKRLNVACFMLLTYSWNNTVIVLVKLMGTC